MLIVPLTPFCQKKCLNLKNSVTIHFKEDFYMDWFKTLVMLIALIVAMLFTRDVLNRYPAVASALENLS